MNLFELFVKIGVDDQASGKISDLSSKLGNGLKTAAKIGTAAVGAVTAATGALYTGITAAAGSVASYGDNIDKMSQKMGMSAEAYQEWDAVMQHSGTSIESLQAGMKTLANAVESGNDAFNRLGISQEEIAKMSNEELFSATITALQNVENETERTYLAGQLLGRGATELGALLNTSAEDTQAMKDRVHELGGVMSNEAVKAAARYQDSLQDMKTSFSGLKNSLISDFLPGMSTVMDGIASLFTGEDGAQSTISSGISQILESMNSSLPKIFDSGKQIVDAIFQAITQNLPQMVSGGIEMLMSIINGIIENIPILVESAAQIIVTFANGIAESLPELIPAIVDVVMQIVETLIANVDKLIMAASEIIVAIAKGLIMSIPQLVKAIPQIIMAIVKGIKSFMSQIINVGTDIVNGLKKGIQNAWNNLVSWFEGLFDDLIGIAKKILGIASPSKVFKKIGGFTAEGFGIGFEDEFARVKCDIENAMKFGDVSVGINASVRKVGEGTDGTDYGSNRGVVSVVQNSVRAAIHDEISKIGIYLDGNTLVGGISERMDNGLGRIYAGNERRAMA